MADVSGEKIGEIFVEINARTKKLEDEIKQLKGKVDKEAENMGASFSSKFTKMLATAGAATAIYQFFKRAVVGAMEAERAEVALRTQLGYTSQALLDQALALQKVTMFEDDTVTKAQSMIAAFTKNETQIIALTKAAADLAAAKGLDLVSAAELVAKTFGSETNALARSGIQVDATAGSTKRLEQITKGLAELYGGQAEAAGKTFAGRMEQLKNRVGNLEEGIGGALIPTLEKLGNALTDMISEGEQASSFMQGIAVAGRIVGSVFLVVKTTLVHIGTLLGTIGAGLYAIATGNFALVPGIISGGFDKITNNAESMISGIKDMWSDLDDVVSKTNNSTVNKIIKGNQTLSDEEKKRLAELKKARIDAEADTYETLKFETADYITWKSYKIEEEVAARKKAGVSEVLLEKYKNFQMQQLFNDWSDWLMKREEEEAKKRFDKVKLWDELEAENKKKNFKMGEVKEPDKPDVVGQVGKELDEQKQSAKQWSQTLASGFMDIVAYGGDALDVIKKMGLQLAEMLVQAIFFKAIWGAMTGGVGLLPGMGAHNGGSFIGTSSGVMKMASGGSFIVPTGYANDSFPLMVETGERVTVTPASQVRSGGDYSGIINALARVETKIGSLNRNLINKQFDAHIYNPIDGTILVKQIVSPTENTLMKAGVSLEKL